MRRTARWSARKTNYVCLGIWTVSLLLPLSFLLVDKDDVFFDYRRYNCNYGFQSRAWKILLPISSAILGLIPNLTIVVATILLLREARNIAMRADQGLRWQGVITVVLTAAMYSISILPFALYYLVEPLVLATEADGSAIPDTYLVYYYRIASAFMNLNVISNFFVYCLTVSSFRNFIAKRIRRLFLCLCHVTSCKG